MNKKVFLSIVLAVFGTFVFSNSVFAYTAVEQKALGYGVYRCYNHLKEGDTNNDVVVGEISFRGVNNYKSLILSNSGDGDSAIALPTGFDGLHRIENDSNISCRDLFGGVDYNGSTGFAGLLGSEKDPQNIEDKKKLLTTLSYASQNGGTGGSGQCFKFKYTFGSLGANYQWQTSDGETAAVCSTTGRVTQSDILFDNNSDSVTNFSLDGNTLTMNLWTLNTSTTQMGGGYSTTNNIYDKKTYTLSNYSSFTALSDAVYADYSAYYGRGRDGWSGGSPNLRIRNVKIPVEACVHFPYGERVGTEEEYSLSPSREQASLIAASNLLGGSFNNVQDLAFLAEEEYSLYKTYFDDYYAADFQCDYGPGQSVTEDSLKNQGYSKITGGSLDGCYAKPTQNINESVYGLSESKYFDGTKLDFKKLINAYSKAAEAASISKEDMATSTTSDTDDANNKNGKTEPTCLSEAGTSLGWILCPVLDAFGGATEWVYDKLVEPALKIDPQLFTGKGDNTRDAWRTFRDIANVFFIILFLVVIFSQLTGVGIDNYGIKKILPKLVVAAVLINLSYIICVIFVDLSNILGNSLRDIFTGLGSQLTIPGSIEGVKVNVGSGILTAIAVLVALIGGVAVAITASGGLVAFLVSLLAVALSAIIALFFLFLLLAAREAAIVVLTVLSPLAFACYILPNTQNIFKKWYQLGWRLLMVYPIAGLLIGGGDYVSKLLLSAGAGSEGFFSAFVAMIAGIVPIFFIPTVLKQSFALMGGLGAKIAGLGKSVGSKVSGDVDKSIRGSERFKNYQADRERNRKLGHARRTNRRLSDRIDNGETLSQRQRDRLARARMVESAEYSDELKRRAIVDGNRYETMRAGIEAKSRDEAINDRLALMQKNGINGGAYSLENMYARMQNLEKSSRTQTLTDDEKGEMAALARGMASRQGGASMLNSIIRSAGSDGKSNSNFMSAMGEIYSNDSAVASKMAEKDAGASAFTEKFMPNGAGYDGDFTTYQGTKEYKDAIDKRIKSYSAGLNQGGAAVTDYINSLDKSDLQAIIDNEGLYNSLDTDVRRAIDERTGSGPKGLNIQRTARQVEIAGENQVFDVHGLDSDTLLDIATNPKISDNDPNRAAAVEELNKRGIK